MTTARHRQPLEDFRVRAIRLGLGLSWVVEGVLVVEGIRLRVFDQTGIPTVGVAVMLAALTGLNWERTVDTAIGKLLLWLWGVVMLAAFGTTLTVEALTDSMLGLYLAFIIFVAVIGSTRPFLLATFAAASSYLLIPVIYGMGRSVSSLIVPAIAVAGVAIITRIVTEALTETMTEVARQKDEIARQNINFERLYEVSRTISAGDRLENVVPELVGRIGTYLECQVGLVLLRDDTNANLQVLSPIWAGGHSLELAGYHISLQGRDPLAAAFRIQQPRIITGIAENPDEFGILGELGLADAMVVSLRVDAQPIGLVVLGDKLDGEPTQSDLLDLESLAAPAALVLAQLDRYTVAAETSKKMEDLARMKTDFVSVVSHELRTPLTSILGALATIARPELAPEREAARELLASARKQADRLRRLIEDLLMVSRIENRALPQQPVETAVEAFLKGVVAEIPEATSRVLIAVDDNAHLIEADADHLHRVFVNLIENAIKYAPDSEVDVSVVPRSNNRIEFSVVDHGPGVDPAQKKAVFDRFTQLEASATRSQGGTGLGLHIVKGLVESMGGQIGLQDTAGGGATFTVTLPRYPRSLPIQVLGAATA